MQLPNATNARIAERKVLAYLLSRTHPTGRSKAELFLALGFSETNCAALIQSLREVANTGSVVATIATPFGTKYVVDGEMPTPSDRQAFFRTIWIIETGETDPRFVTAYPL
jgi:hypothetical protein